MWTRFAHLVNADAQQRARDALAAAWRILRPALGGVEAIWMTVVLPTFAILLLPKCLVGDTLVAGSGAFAGESFAPLVRGLAPDNYLVRDFTQGHTRLLALSETGYRFDVGRYNERRPAMYTSSLFRESDPWADASCWSYLRRAGRRGARDIHVGIDVGGAAGTPVRRRRRRHGSCGVTCQPGRFAPVGVRRRRRCGPLGWVQRSGARLWARHSGRAPAQRPAGVGALRPPERGEHRCKEGGASRGRAACFTRS